MRLAESVGFDYIGVTDSQSLFRELFVSLAVAAMETERVHLGPSTNCRPFFAKVHYDYQTFCPAAA